MLDEEFLNSKSIGENHKISTILILTFFQRKYDRFILTQNLHR